MRSVRAPFGPCPGEDGKSPGRTTPCGQSRYVWIRVHISHFRQGSSLGGATKDGAPKRPAAAPLGRSLEVHRRGEEDLPRVSVIGGEDAGLAECRAQAGRS